MIGTLNGLLWGNGMLILIFGVGLIMSLSMGFPQIRKIPTMIKLLFNGKESDSGLSSFQAFTLAIAGRVGTGNIVGVATAVGFGGPGALFWMWCTALIGASLAYVEAAMSQLHKRRIDGEYRGGWVYYFHDKLGVVAGCVAALIFIAVQCFTQTWVHTAAMTTALNDAFGIPPLATGIVISALLAIIVIGGAKRVGHFAEIVVPIMSVIYILMALIVLFANVSQIPAAFALIFKSAFGVGPIAGAALGTAMQWGVKRAIFSSEIGFGNASAPAASAEVSHPAKQGLVQAFSVYVDTLFVCTATGLTLVITGCYNVTSPDGTLLFTGISESIPAGSGWVMEAFSTVFGFAPQFVGIALFFFAFTTILNQNYSANTYMSWFFRDKDVQPMWSKWVINIIYLVCPIIGAFFTMQGAWDVGDVGIGLTVWVNTLFLIFFGLVPCRKLLKNFEMHQKAGEDEIFDPDEFEGEKFDNADLDLWRDIRDGYRKGALKE